MGAVFNADEVFEMAEQIERNGAKFYRKAAQGSASASAELLTKLAVMEDAHEKTFADMRAELSAVEQASTAFDPDDQAKAYLQAIADGHVFNTKIDPSEVLTGSETIEQILTKAIGLEKDSIVFYLGMKNAVGQALGKDKMDHIIAEEMDHITLLSEELARAQ